MKKTVEELLHEEEELDLRPKTLADYIGQQHVKESLRIAIDAATIRRKPIDHILIYGPPGMGKTTIASVIAHEMQSHLWRSTGPAITSPRDLATIVANLEKGDVLFIDEIHRLNSATEESLYPVMEDFALHITLGKGPTAKAVEIPLSPFTLVGATTRAGLLTSPLRDRFGLVFRLGHYSPDEMLQIVRRSAVILKVHLDDNCAQAIALRSRGTPRIANRLLKRAIDFALARNQGILDHRVVEETFNLMKIDHMGLDEMDRKLLRIIATQYGGGPVGMEAICAILGEDRDTVEDVYEPYLIQSGLLERTPRGRLLTAEARKHLSLEAELDLFT